MNFCVSYKKFLAMVLFLTVVSANALAKDQLNIQNCFTASGWMGDGEYGRKYIDFDGANDSHPHSKPDSIKVTYKFGLNRWAGIYWQNKPDNWGDKPGTDYSKKGFKKIVFWARGGTGGEVVEFKAGDISNPNKKYHDSFGVSTGRVTLSKDWKKYEIDLRDSDLSSVIGGFCWVASKDYNRKKNKITFYIDDIIFE